APSRPRASHRGSLWFPTVDAGLSPRCHLLAHQRSSTASAPTSEDPMSLVHGIRAALLSCALTAILTACGSKDACSGGETQECFGSMPCTCYCAGTQACGTGMPD